MNFQPVDQMDPGQFEQLVFRFLWRFGFINLQRLGGSGDRGRDLLAESIETPVPGITVVSKWVVQCKRYSHPITKVGLLEELASSAQHHPDYYLLVGTFTMSSAQRDWLTDMQRNYHFRILAAAADTLARWFAAAPDIAFDFKDTVGPRPFTAAMDQMIAAVSGAANVAPPVLRIFSETLGEACAQNAAAINTLHLLTAISNCATSEAARFLDAAGAPRTALNVVASRSGRTPSGFDHPTVGLSQNLRIALPFAANLAGIRSQPVNDLDLLAALLQTQDGGATRTLASIGVSVDRLRLAVDSASASATPSPYPETS